MSDGNEKLYDFVGRSNAAGLLCEDPSRTVQSQLEDSDINTIVRRFGVTGHLPQGPQMPTYQDFEDVFDFQSAMAVILQAEDSFMSMPAEIRGRFLNDPQVFMEFCSDPNNAQELVRMGLAVEKPPADPIPAPSADPAPEPS